MVRILMLNCGASSTYKPEYAFQALARIAILPLMKSLWRSPLGLTSGEMYPAATRSRTKPRAALYSSVSMSFTSLPPESSRQLFGARKTPWNHNMEYGPVVVSLVTPSAHLPASGRVSCLHRFLKSSAVFGGVAPIWSSRFCWTYMGQPVMDRGMGTP